MTERFTKQSTVPFPAEKVFEWHARPGAIERLSPPWDPLEVLERLGGIETGATVKMKMKAGNFSYNWFAKHTDYTEGRLFRDEQVRGPFKRWIHTHQFDPVSAGGSQISDTIEYEFPVNPIAAPLFNQLIQKKLSRIFAFRHFTTVNDLKRHQQNRTGKKLTVVLTGASGLIGANLSAFLTTGGHQVYHLVRRSPRPGEKEIFWDPQTGELDLSPIDTIDAVVHLAGENIGYGRWTANKKKVIVDSRVNSTGLLVQKMTERQQRPATFLSASAIGYYGDRGNSLLTEASTAGTDFISEVCQKWEAAAVALNQTDIRLVTLRIGVVLDPRGGALGRLLLPFKIGLGSRIGSGAQMISWITLDDAIGAIYHCLMEKTVEGPVNIVAPNPVSNLELTKAMGKTLGKPTLGVLPQQAIKLLFGQQGEEILLSSARVSSGKLEESGFWYGSPNLSSALATVFSDNRH